MTSFLEMPATAVKLGREYEKDGKKHRYDTVTFLTHDGDSFKLTNDGLNLAIKTGDMCVFGTRSIMTDEKRPAVSLTITTARPAAVQGKQG